MKITKLWKGFEADHSSTNYSFYATEGALTEEDKKHVNSYSSRARASKHSVEFTYSGDFADLPDGAREELLDGYFDVMIRESYDWWELELVLPYTKSLHEKMQEYGCEDEDELGITISLKGEKIHLLIYCMLDYDAVYDLTDGDIEPESEDYWSPLVIAGKPFPLMANLLIGLKIELLKGNYTTLQGIAACFDPENFEEPVNGSELNDWFTSVLGRR
ncbi:MAG: hypothetical protein ACTSP4_15610 [Candidatus Hodarchaeales archaeon]